MLKRFKNHKQGPFATKNVINQIVTQAGDGSGPGGIGLADMRLRLKILDAIETEADHVDMIPEYYTKLKELIDKFQFAIVNKDLLAVVDDILDAEDIKEKDAHQKMN